MIPERRRRSRMVGSLMSTYAAPRWRDRSRPRAYFFGGAADGGRIPEPPRGGVSEGLGAHRLLRLIPFTNSCRRSHRETSGSILLLKFQEPNGTGKDRKNVV